MAESRVTQLVVEIEYNTTLHERVTQLVTEIEYYYGVEAAIQRLAQLIIEVEALYSEPPAGVISTLYQLLTEIEYRQGSETTDTYGPKIQVI